MLCCGADKHVDPANELSLMRVSKVTAKDNEGSKGEVTNITKVTIYCQIYKRVCKVRGGYIRSSARMVMLITGMVES